MAGENFRVTASAKSDRNLLFDAARFSDRAVDHGDAVLASMRRGEPLLELGDLGPVQPSPFAAVQYAEQTLFLGLAEDGP